jgi:thioredoxin-related protein
MRAKISDTALTLATIVMSSVAIWLGTSRKLPNAIDSILWPPAPVAAQPALPASNRDDRDRLLAVTSVDFSQSDRTLLVVVRSDCRYCTASKPFYAELLKRERATLRAVRVFLVAPLNDVNFPSYLADLPFANDRRLQVSTDSLGVNGTPTLLLVDRNGRVKETWVGKLPTADELAVINAAFPNDGNRAN